MIAGPIADRCRSWGELHTELAKEEISYETKGSGAIFKIGTEFVKASTYRKAAIGPLTKRFGPFEAAKKQVAIRAPASAPGIGVNTADAFAVAKMAAMRHKADLAAAAFPPPLARALRQAAPDVRTIAGILGEPPPSLIPLRRHLDPANNDGPHCDALHAALEADFYSLVIKQTPSEKHPVNWLVSRPKHEDNASQPWPPMPIAEAEDEETFIIPHSSRRHFIVLAGLTNAGVSALRKDGIKPAIIVAVGRECDVLLVAARETDDPDELDAAEETARALAGRYAGRPTAVLRAPGLRPRMAHDPERDTPREQILVMSSGFCSRVSEMVRQTYAAARRRLRIVTAGLRRNGASLYDVALSEIPARLRRTLAASVLDGLIARQLHAQGQPVAAVIDVICHHAPLARPARRPVLDWPLYAAWIVDRAVRPSIETSRHLAAQDQPATPAPGSIPRLAATAEPPTSDAAAVLSEAREPGASAKAVMPVVKRPTRVRSRRRGGMEM